MIGTIGMCPAPKDNEWERNANPHMFRIKEGLEKRDWKIVALEQDDLWNPERIREQGVDIIYIHWATSAFAIENYARLGISPVFHYRITNVPKLRKAYRHLLQLYRCFLDSFFKERVTARALRDLGLWKYRIKETDIPIVWHQHDLLSHSHKNQDSLLSRIDIALHRTLFEMSRALVFNEESCKEPVFEFYGGSKEYVTAFMGRFQELPAIDKESARKRLGLSLDDRIFLYSGSARKNRNPAQTVEVFKRVMEICPGARLIVASRHCRKFLPRSISDKVLVQDDFMEPEEMRDLFCASDFLINDAREYLTSAVVRSAVAWNLPVIAYEFGSVTDMAKGAHIPILPEGQEEKSLEMAMVKALQLDKKEYDLMVQNCKDNDEYRTWDRGLNNLDRLFKEIMISKGDLS